jgi:hypothetical protein
MSLFLSNKAVRLLLSVSVSIWMAGGCLFGCTTDVIGSERVQENVVEHGPSCHVTTHTTSNLKLPRGVAYFVPEPGGMMKDCPLGLNATAATSKSSGHMPEPARGPVAALPTFEKQALQPEYPHVVPFLHNRGSTHLQCCVFLI